MAKVKTPLLSFDAHGSLGDSLTFRRHAGGTVAEKKPRLPYFLTLPSQYQRWLYQDYVYLWHQQSIATKQFYATTGARHHLTGFQYWMKYHLTNLPDIAGLWYLDEKSGSVAHDASRYLTHGTIVGASPTVGLIAGAYDFTPASYIEITCPQLDFTSEDFSLLLRFKVDDLTTERQPFGRGKAEVDGWYIVIQPDGSIYFVTNQVAVRQFSISSVGSILVGNWYTVGFSRTGASIRIYVNGVDVTHSVGFHIDPLTCARSAKIGIYDNLFSYPFDGKIDHVIVFIRALTAADHLRHSLRRWPSG
jgi:hypothetical protein